MRKSVEDDSSSSSDEYESDDGEDVALRMLINIDRLQKKRKLQDEFLKGPKGGPQVVHGRITTFGDSNHDPPKKKLMALLMIHFSLQDLPFTVTELGRRKSISISVTLSALSDDFHYKVSFG